MYDKFKPVLSLFAKCHFIYNQKFVSEEKAKELGMCIAFVRAHTHTHHSPIFFFFTEASIVSFMDVFRRSFPSATIPPKMHMLEDHTMEWVRARNVGFGLLGEQGAESIHARFNSLGRTYAFVPMV